ncbi:MAG: DUF87 domain-containing protein [Candidatus Woesearchaeota archaeon]
MNNQDRHKHLYHLGLILLVLFAINGLVMTGRFIGYVSHTANAGDITELELTIREGTTKWAGLYGAAFGVGVENIFSYDLEGGDTVEANIFFECFQPDIEHEIYASMVPEVQIDFPSLRPATISDIEDYIDSSAGVSPFSGLDSVANTFSSTVTFHVGVQILNVPGTYTYVDTGIGTDKTTTIFNIGALKDSDDNLVFVAKANENLTKGFNRRFYNYQMLLPIHNNSQQTYYLWSDPTDVCPEGEGESFNKGYVYGHVTSETGTPLESVLIDIAGFTTVTNAAGFYNLSTNEGTWYVYAIKVDYKVFQGNVTVVRGNGTEYNIVLSTDVVSEKKDVGPGEDDPGDSTSTGTDVGPGKYQQPPVLQEPKRIEGEDFVITPSYIRRKLRIDNYFQEVITIFSFKPGTTNINYVLEGDIKKLVTLDKDRSSIAPNSKDTLVATLFGRPPVGMYNGTLKIIGDITQEIPVEIEVLPRDLIPVEALVMTIDVQDNKLNPGQDLKFQVDMRNMLSDQEYPVRLTFIVQDIEGKNTIWTYTTNTLLKTSFTIIRTVKLPSDLPVGDYVIRVNAEYMDLTSGVSSGFEVTTPFLQYQVLGILPVWQLLLLSILLAGGVGTIFVVRRRMDSKKKYHLKVEFSELPEAGSRSAFVGKIAETNKRAYFKLENFKTHTIVAGSTGGGKSFAAQGIIEEMLLKNVAVIVFDPTAQWTGMLRKLTNKGIFSLFPGFDMKPSEARAFNGNIRQITDPYEKIRLKDYMKPGEIQVFALHKMDPKDIDIFVANTVREVFHENFDEAQLLRLALVYDEVHRLLPKFGGSGLGFLQIERACREFRKWGIGVVLISQVLSDFMGQIKANINTEVQLRTRDEGDLDRIATKYGKDVLQSLVKASVGTGMVENPAYNRGKPYFITFRPILHSVERLNDEELEQYNKYNDMVDDLQSQLKQLEDEGIDVFDLKLELKLALDKVKSGNFNMVQIYLDGLTPRVKAHWDKLGKQPKKYARERVSEEDIKADLAKAQEEKKKADALTSKSEPAKEEKKGPPGFKDDVSPDKILNLVNGMIVINLASLYDEIAAMKDRDFEHHVHPGQNDFAKWINEAVGDTELGAVVAGLLDRKEILNVLDLRRNAKPLPKPNAPPQPEAEKPEEAKQETAKANPSDPKHEAPKPEEVKTEKQKEEDTNKAKKNDTDLEQIVADPAHTFKLEDGTELHSIKDLREYVPKMNDDVFNKHITPEKNDFAQWIRDVFHNKELAEKVSRAHDRESMEAALA